MGLRKKSSQGHLQTDGLEIRNKRQLGGAVCQAVYYLLCCVVLPTFLFTRFPLTTLGSNIGSTVGLNSRFKNVSACLICLD